MPISSSNEFWKPAGAAGLVAAVEVVVAQVTPLESAVAVLPEMS